MSEEWSLPPAEFDGAWKEALDHACELFLAAFVVDVHAAIDWRQDYESLDQELQKLAPESASGLRRVDKLVKLLDWLLRLPAELDRQVTEELRRLRPEGAMTYITSWERMGRRSALRTMLEARFEGEGAVLADSLPEDLSTEQLENLIRVGATAKSLDEVR